MVYAGWQSQYSQIKINGVDFESHFTWNRDEIGPPDGVILYMYSYIWPISS